MDSLNKHRTNCNQCGAVLTVRTNHLGKRCRCPACKELITITTIRSTEATAASPADHSNAAVAPESLSINESGLLSRSSDGVHESSDKIPVQKQLGRFDLLKKLGQGAFGEVWLARDRGLERSVAIKLPKFRADDVKRVNRFVTEAKVAASLRHPNIVPTLDAGQIDGQHYIATEFVEGLPLSEVNNRGKAPPKWAVMIVCKLAEAVHYAHQQSIVHRDIKPDNVLIDKHGEPQLLDFGLAKRLDSDASQTVDGTVMGTPGYMSPEQARGATSEVGPASDQYSLGVTLYRLLAGRTPFTGQPAAVLQQIITVPPPPLSEFVGNLGADLEAICEKARSMDPRDRYTNCQLFADDLRAYLAGESVSARPLSRLKKAMRWSARHPREATLAGLSIGIGILSFALSSIGWANAIKNESAAARSQKLVEAETNRIQSLEQSLQTRVEEAAALRDAARRAQEAEAASRKTLEAENEKLTAAIVAAETALSAAQNAATQLESEQSTSTQLQADFDTVLKGLEESQAEASSRHDTPVDQIPTLKLPSISKTPPLQTSSSGSIYCEWDGVESKFKIENRVSLQVVSQLPLGKFIRDVSFDETGEMTVSWGSGTTPDMGVASIDALGNLRTRVPIYIAASTDQRSEATGALWFYTGSHVQDHDGNVILTLGQCGPNYIIKYDQAKKAFEVIASVDPIKDLDRYPRFDATGLYVHAGNQVIRFEGVEGIGSGAGVPVFRIGDKNEFASSIEFLSKNLVFVSLHKSSRDRRLILDRASGRAFPLKEINADVLATDPQGRLVVRFDYKSIAICVLPTLDLESSAK